MFYILFRRISPWAGGTLKAFFYTSPVARDNARNPAYHGCDSAMSSWTKPQLEAFVFAAKEALAQWPE